MSNTRWLVVGSALSLGVAWIAFTTRSTTSGVVIVVAVATWLGWAFTGDRG